MSCDDSFREERRIDRFGTMLIPNVPGLEAGPTDAPQLELNMAFVHDYLTQTGGAERVALAIASGFNLSTIHTTFYDEDSTFTEFRDFKIEHPKSNFGWLAKKNIRLTLPIMRRSIRNIEIPDADVVICSSSGWAHGVRTDTPKVIYFHTPARWLYEKEDFFKGPTGALRPFIGGFEKKLRIWDREAVESAEVLVANSSTVAARIQKVYGREARVVHPPVTINTEGVAERPPGVPDEYLLIVARKRGYKNVDEVCHATKGMGIPLIVVGGDVGIEDSSAVIRLGRVPESELRWLYRNCSALIAAAHEDFGLTPIEANSYGRPVVALRRGGYLDSMVEGTTAVFFERLAEEQIQAAISEALKTQWVPETIRRNAARFRLDEFIRQLGIAAREATEVRKVVGGQ